MRAARLVALALLCALAGPAPAQRQVVIYRCTDAKGALTVQNDVACPKGSREQRQVIDVPPPLPAYQPRAERMPTIVAAEEQKAQERIAEALPPPVAEADRQPPPPLFQCTTWQQDTYLTEEATPAQRCAPLQVVGLDGRAVSGGAQACQNVPDQCEAVPDEGLCSAWKRRVDEARFRWKFADGNDANARELEHAKLAAVLANSTCAP